MTIDLESPEWFLYGVDAEKETFQFVRTGEQHIRSASFLDGRVNVSTTGETRELPIRRGVDSVAAASATPDRFIVHTSFCGSTFLSKLLDVPGKTLCYREPQVLVDLARMKVDRSPIAGEDSLWESVLRFTLAQLRKHWGKAQTLVKPSNWANIVLPDLVAVSSDITLVRLSSDDEAFLSANLRGGQERIRYSLNLLNALLQVGYVHRPDVEAAEASKGSSLEQVLRLLLVLHRAQRALLGSSMEDSGLGCDCAYKDLARDPVATANRCADHLGLDLAPADLESSYSRESAVHSKDDSNAYDAGREQTRNSELREQFSAEIASAMDWSRSVLRR